MRLLVVLNDAADLARHRQGVVDAAEAAGHEVHLAVPEPTLHLLEGRPRVHGYALERRSLGVGSNLRSVRSLRRLYLRVRPDVVHHFTLKPVVLGTQAAKRLRGVGVVNSVTGLGHAFTRRGPVGMAYRAAARTLLRRAARARRSVMVFQNTDDAAAIAGAGGTVVPGSGVDLAAFPARPPPVNDRVQVVLPARLNGDKGVRDLVRAARSLRDQGVPVDMVLAGAPDPGNPTAIPEAEVRAWVEEGVVSWLGWCDDMATVYAEADVVVLPTHGGEGVPRCLLEAAATGRPLVATDVPGCRDVVVPGETGLLVPPRDVRALADALRALAADPALRERMGEAARRLAEERFDERSVVAAYLEIYERVAGGR